MQTRDPMRRLGKRTHKNHTETGQDLDGFRCLIDQNSPQCEIVAIGKGLVEQTHILVMGIRRIADNPSLALQFGV